MAHFFLCMRLMRIKIFTCASRCAYPHMRIIRMNRMDPQPHGQPYWGAEARNRPVFFGGNIKVWALSWHSLQELGGYFVKRLLVNRCHSLGLSIERAKSGQKQVFPIWAIITLEIFQVGVCQMQVRFACSLFQERARRATCACIWATLCLYQL